MLIIIFFTTVAAKLIVSIIYTVHSKVKPRPSGAMRLRTVVTILHCQLTSMNSTDEILLVVRFLIVDLCVLFTRVIFSFILLYTRTHVHCTQINVICIKLLLTYFLTYLIR